MIIKSYRRDYSVDFTDSLDFLDSFHGNNHFFIVDANIVANYPVEERLPKQRTFVLDATEENKTLDRASDIIDRLVTMDSKKKTILVAIGGGIVQDLTCFVASVLYRGINWVLVPTTLLAQTDSCIGSKSSINYKGFKNLLGTFYPPSKIIVSNRFLDSLTDRDYLSGLGEIAKIQMMISKNNFRDFSENLDKIVGRDYREVYRFVESTLDYKKGLIEEDEFDAGIRNILNFGHTFGHAIESTTHYYVPHGQAVSIGMLIANRVSVARGLIDKTYVSEIERTLLQIISPEFKKAEVYSADGIVKAMRMDKKFTGAHNCVLLTENGAKVFEGIDEKLIVDAIDQVVAGFSS